MKKLLISVLASCYSLILIGQYQPCAKGELIEHTYYSLSYIEEHEQAEWVYYTIQKGNTKRTDDFRPDPKVSTKSASLADYKGTGYDRGHLCPAAAMKINHTAMSETFYMSNMSPQLPSFNRGIWKDLESMVRKWGWNIETHVVTGPVFKDNIESIGENKVSVPGYYYKAIYQPSNAQMIAFVLPNEKSTRNISEYIITVDSLEQLTGIDFFPQIDKELQLKLEREKGDLSLWKSTYTNDHPTQPLIENSNSQCKGYTKITGNRCKIKTKNSNGYCHHHQNQAE